MHHNPDVDSSEKLIKMIENFGGDFSKKYCSGTYGNSPDVPVFSSTHNFCLFSRPGKSRSKFDCSASPTPVSQNKKRICYCHESFGKL